MVAIDTKKLIEAAKKADLSPVTGGFSNAERGLFLFEGRQYFAKRAVDTQTSDWLSKEAATYSWLKDKQYSHTPDVHFANNEVLILEDLSRWDWSNTWTAGKLNCALGAIEALHSLRMSHDKVYSADQLIQKVMPKWQELNNPQLLSQLEKKLSALPFNPTSLTEFHNLVKKSDLFEEKVMTHMDLRADNMAYNSKTNQVKFIDWNWTQRGNPKFELAPFLVNVIKHSVDEDVLQIARGKVNRLAALTIAGFWFHQSLQQPFIKGDPSGLREHQLQSALVAFELSGF